jgi:hypothetical protein
MIIEESWHSIIENGFSRGGEDFPYGYEFTLAKTNQAQNSTGS